MSKPLQERIEALAGENRIIEKVKETKIDKRKFNKGLPQSGRKPKEVNLVAKGIKEYLDAHFNEKLDFQISLPEGKTVTVQKSRIILVLEKLYQIGMNGEGNADALNKWLDRALGKPMQTIAGDKENPPFQLQINIANILNKAYGNQRE